MSMNGIVYENKRCCKLDTFDKVNKHVVVHMSQILCCPVSWIIEVCSIGCLLQSRPPRRVVWYFAILLSSYTYCKIKNFGARS